MIKFQYCYMAVPDLYWNYKSTHKQSVTKANIVYQLHILQIPHTINSVNTKNYQLRNLANATSSGHSQAISRKSKFIITLWVFILFKVQINKNNACKSANIIWLTLVVSTIMLQPLTSKITFRSTRESGKSKQPIVQTTLVPSKS